MIEFNSQAMNKALKLYIRISVEYWRIVGNKQTDNINANEMCLLSKLINTFLITTRVAMKVIVEKSRPAIIWINGDAWFIKVMLKKSFRIM